MTVEAYTGYRDGGTLVVIRHPQQTRLTPERSLTLVSHSPSGFEVGYRGSGPAQLACALLLDYYDDEQLALDHYTGFKEDVVSRLDCSGPTGQWRLTGRGLEDAVGIRRSTEIPVSQSP